MLLVTVNGPVVEVHVVAAPLTVNVTLPDGAGNPAFPIRVALKVSGTPTVGLIGVELKIIEGVAAPTLTVTIDEVAPR